MKTGRGIYDNTGISVLSGDTATPYPKPNVNYSGS